MSFKIGDKVKVNIYPAFNDAYGVIEEAADYDMDWYVRIDGGLVPCYSEELELVEEK